MTSRKTVATALIVGCVAVVMSAVPAFAAQKPPVHEHPAAAAATPAAAMDPKCQGMMAEHEKMMADMTAADQRLDALVATMNTAADADRGLATAAVVTEMATAGRTMRDAKAKMDQDMMVHMMEHMQAGKDSMAGCPMMKPMGDVKH